MREQTQPTDIFDQLVMEWGCPLVARSEVRRFSGGLLNPRTLANLDVRGEIPGKIMVGNRVAYQTAQLAGWMRERSRGKGGSHAV